MGKDSKKRKAAKGGQYRKCKSVYVPPATWRSACMEKPPQVSNLRDGVGKRRRNLKKRGKGAQQGKDSRVEEIDAQRFPLRSDKHKQEEGRKVLQHREEGKKGDTKARYEYKQ